MALLEQLSIQMYSVRELAAQNLPYVLQKLRNIGFTGVEMAGLYGLEPQYIKSLLEEQNLLCIGSHVSYQRILENLKDEIACSKILGGKYMICPITRPQSKEEVLAIAQNLNEAARQCSGEGLQIGYHNHAHEFLQLEDCRILNFLFDHLIPEIVLELDVYWAAYSGVNPVDFLKQWKGRIGLLHLKQIGTGPKQSNIAIKDGRLDFSELVQTARQYGIEQFILEQEQTDFSRMQQDIDFLM